MKISLTLLSLLFPFVLAAQNKTKDGDDFYLEYSSPAKTILIKGNTITLQEWPVGQEAPVSSMPGSRKEKIKTASISSADLVMLKKAIRKNGFMALAKNEYGSGNSIYYYSFMISIYSGGKQKTVVYWSNPVVAAEQAPEEFTELEQKTNELISGIKDWE